MSTQILSEETSAILRQLAERLSHDDRMLVAQVCNQSFRTGVSAGVESASEGFKVYIEAVIAILAEEIASAVGEDRDDARVAAAVDRAAVRVACLIAADRMLHEAAQKMRGGR